MDKVKREKRKFTGFPGDCSEEQLQSLERFREIVKGHNGGELRSNWDDPYLLRFLRARKFDMKDTEKMWVDFITWRKEKDVDNSDVLYFPQVVQLRKIYPHGYHKHDRKYRPIYIERLGMTHPDDVFEVADEHQLLSYYAMSYEFLISGIFDACSRQKKLETGDKTRVMQTCTILDLKGIKLSNTSAAYKFAKPASKMAQDNYPQILGNMFVVNAPMMFTAVWAVVKMWIDDKTKEKIQIFGSSYKKELLRYIDAENLPDFLDGGTCQCKGGNCLATNIGPWNPEGNQIYPHCLEKMQKPVRMSSQEKGEQMSRSNLLKQDKQRQQIKMQDFQREKREIQIENLKER